MTGAGLQRGAAARGRRGGAARAPPLAAPLRVAYVLGTASGGTARHAGLLAEGCRRAGLAVLAAGPDASRAAFAAGAASLPGAAGAPSGPIAYHRAEITARPRPVRDLAALAALRRVLRRAGPDIVHAHGLRAGAFAAAALVPSRPSRRPALVVTVHNAPPAGRAARAVYRVLELACARRADLLLCASADLAAGLRRRARGQVTEFDVPAPPAPPPSAAAVTRARAALGPPGRPAVLAVGRLAEQKGLDTLLAAARCWQDRVPVPVAGHRRRGTAGRRAGGRGRPHRRGPGAARPARRRARPAGRGRRDRGAQPVGGAFAGRAGGDAGRARRSSPRGSAASRR